MGSERFAVPPVDSEALPWMMLCKGSQDIGAFKIAAAGRGTMKTALVQEMAERIRATQVDELIFTAELGQPTGPAIPERSTNTTEPSATSNPNQTKPSQMLQPPGWPQADDAP